MSIRELVKRRDIRVARKVKQAEEEKKRQKELEKKREREAAFRARTTRR